ncbi:hypothetical protein WI26_28635 [Burkholderia diffusa]|nr:hypothetical protein WI26_28635 [Burkholderia diffusa]
MVSIGDQIYLATNSPFKDGALVGRIDLVDPTRSQLGVSFRYRHQGHSLWFMSWVGAHAVGTWVAQGASVSSLATFASHDIREPSLPYGRASHKNRNNEFTYNGHVLLQPGRWGAGGGMGGDDMPVGTQIMNDDAKWIIALAVIQGEPFEFGAMVGYHDYFIHSWGVENGEMMRTMCGGKGGSGDNSPAPPTDIGYERYQLNVQPIGDSKIEFRPISGTVQLTSSNVISSVPATCSNVGNIMACPIRTDTNTGADGFTLKVPSAMSGKVWLLVNGQQADSMRMSDLNNSTGLAVSAEYLNELLGPKDEMYLHDIALHLVPDQAPGFKIPISLWSDVLLKRITFGVEITERDPSANGSYSGVVGQDPDIVVPLSIRQFGISRASKVQVNVVADNVQTHEGLQCKFVGNNGATVVGIPSTLRFYNGTELVDRPDNCTGRMHDITKMRWRETLGGLSPYDAHLDMDLIFPLGPSVRFDTARNEWFGRVEAKGEVRVRAEWN